MRNEVFNAPFNQVFEAVVDAIKKSNFKIDTKSKEKGLIIAKAGISALSWEKKLV